MPPVAIAAGIAGAFALGGAALQSRSQGKATDAQSKATAEALAFQKQQEATRRQEYDKAMTQYEAKWGAWNASRNALLQRYGIDIGSSAPSPAVSASTGPRPPGGPATGQPAGMPQPGGPAGMPPGAQVAQGQNLRQLMRPPAELGSWNDWNRQGIGA